MKYSCNRNEAAVKLEDKRATAELRSAILNNDNNNSNANGNNNLNNNARFASNNPSISKATIQEQDLYSQLCTYKNLELAWRKARKHKTLKPYVIEFEKNLKENLLLIRLELLLHSYRPKPLEIFILRDPKTRVISKSDFRDRVVHHALCNIIEPIFEKTFIHDSYANRKGKGTHKSIQRFEQFKRKVTKNNTAKCFVLKADIKHYFDNVDHDILIKIISNKIQDKRVLFLIKTILKNHKIKQKGKGMPLGNLTSQFFANVYLNELDYYIKHTLRIKHYLRYVDDFVILHKSEEKLAGYKEKINSFLKKEIDLELHPEKSNIISTYQGTTFLGLRIFSHYKLLKKNNIRKFKNKFTRICKEYDNNLIDYDVVYDFLEGWLTYAKTANTYKLREKIIKSYEIKFKGNISEKEYNKYTKLIMNPPISSAISVK
ncbi:MAG: reverse transcriptase/maturase family protein [Nanoarchaeota archaeon]|nr:reverse transcriptase/maturase family protein [Nanoarchaeota archaeon]MBU1321949.1 reverse transcriptase/maturase family protein [Nanoarchaeota archaeon]MBU1597945.1 reverse transcriptase/maturase family protein [Nanoarchaeota archaeon]